MHVRLTAISWLDWKLGLRLLLKYPALTIIGGLSLAAAIALGAVGIELAGELLYTRLPFVEGDRVVRLETHGRWPRRAWSSECSTISRSGVGR